MKKIWILGLALALVLTAVGTPVSGKHYSEWSAAVRLASISTVYMDSCPAFSKDGLSLYFVSYDPAVNPSTKRDIYVSQRASVDDPWGIPQKLGSNINTSADEERCPYITPDGRRFIFVRQTAAGDDFYMSIRRDKKDDFAWGTPVKINALSSPGMETAGWGFEDRDGKLTFYFGSSRAGTLDIYQTTMDSDGNFTAPVAVSELNKSDYIDYFPVVSKDGLEMYLTSNRAGTLGGQDNWVSTRSSTSEKWSDPVNLGPAINSTANEWRSAVTWDGSTMIFASNVTGNYDLYTSQRTKIKGQTNSDQTKYIFTTIDKPGAYSSNVLGINARGDIVGCYDNPNAVYGYRGFLLSDGVYQEIDYPGALKTIPTGIGPSGDIVGSYLGTDTFWHGFLRTKDSRYSSVNYPGDNNTQLQSIGPDGTMYGCAWNTPYFDNHAVVISSNGKAKNTTEYSFATHYAATPDGQTMVGVYRIDTLARPVPPPDRAYIVVNGKFAPFDVPNSSMSMACDICPAGQTIVGVYQDSTTKSYSGFVAQKNGAKSAWDFTKIDYQGSSELVIATRVLAVNASGDIVGAYNHSDGIYHAFLATRHGN